MWMLRLWLLIVTIAFCGVQSASAGDTKLYYFGATGCNYCADGLAFLERLEQSDARIKLRSFDIVASSSDATAFAKVVMAVGLGDPRVPMTVIGHRVIIGYASDETTGEEIRVMLELCRVTSCPDLLGPVIDDGTVATYTAGRSLGGAPSESGKLAAKSGWLVERRFADAARRQ